VLRGIFFEGLACGADPDNHRVFASRTYRPRTPPAPPARGGQAEWGYEYRYLMRQGMGQYVGYRGQAVSRDATPRIA